MISFRDIVSNCFIDNLEFISMTPRRPERGRGRGTVEVMIINLLGISYRASDFLYHSKKISHTFENSIAYINLGGKKFCGHSTLIKNPKMYITPPFDFYCPADKQKKITTSSNLLLLFHFLHFFILFVFTFFINKFECTAKIKKIVLNKNILDLRWYSVRLIMLLFFLLLKKLLFQKKKKSKAPHPRMRSPASFRNALLCRAADKYKNACP